MSFDIATTPTLEAVATQDERVLAQDLQKRVEEAIRIAESQPEVLEAIASEGEAEGRLNRLRKAERSLNLFAKESRERAAAMGQAALEEVIGSAAAGGAPDFKPVLKLTALENQNHFATRAIQKLVEELIPLAQIANLRESSHALLAKARAVEQMAQERAEKLLGHLRDAVTEEMVLPVDLSKGVSGALLAHASGLKKLAVQVSENADEWERGYRERRGR